MSKHITKCSRSPREYFRDQHRFEHWYVDNQIYFLTARVRDRLPAFAGDEAKAIFWDRFDHYTAEAGFKPWITTLLDNHYHTLGYIEVGLQLKLMMQRLHGSTAKLVNDLLEQRRIPLQRDASSTPRLTPFWRDAKGKEYFDGCIRDTKQCRLAYRYILKQAPRHGICADHTQYPHTREAIELERGIKRACDIDAFMEGVPYKRYQRPRE